jgi:chromate transporter
MNDESNLSVTEPNNVSLVRFVGYFLRLGTVGFGGPIALAGRMLQDLVEKRNWISREDYFEGLALAQLAPGPLAAQLAIYLGYIRAGVFGATAVGVAFVLPSFLMVLGISAAYVRFGGLPWMQAVFYGVGAAAIGIIARSAIKLVKMTLKNDPLLWIIFAALALSTAITKREIIWLFFSGGVLSLLLKGFPGGKLEAGAALMPVLVTSSPFTDSKSLPIFAFFAKAGLFVFGSGLAIVPFLHGGVVLEHHWLSEKQFVDAVAVAMITPGPVVITVAFIGYLVAGATGAFAAAAGVFLPVYLIVIFLAPFYRRFSNNRQLRAFIQGVTAAAVGAITGAVVVLARQAIYDGPTALIAVMTLVLLLKSKIPEPVLILGSAAVGLVVRNVQGGV